MDNKRKLAFLNNPQTALPNAGNAVLEDRNFTEYIFSDNNAEGKAKGVAFTRRLGYTKDTYKELSEEIKASAQFNSAVPIGDNGHGMKHEQKMILYGLKDKPANVVVGWIYQEGKPRMTSCYITEVDKSES